MTISQDHVYSLEDGKQVLVVRKDSLHATVYYLPRRPKGFNLTTIPMKLPERKFLAQVKKDEGPSKVEDLVW